MTLVARDIMNPDVIAVPMSMDLRDLARLFLAKGITGAPVVDERGDLAGVISQTDLIFYSLTRDDELKTDSAFYQSARVEGQHVPRGFQIEDCNTGSVGDVMTPLVHAVTERSTVEAVSRLMTRKHIHRVIVRRGRKVAGIISALDVLKARDEGPRDRSSRPRRPARAR
jgi:CBS domain-containing protein